MKKRTILLSVLITIFLSLCFACWWAAAKILPDIIKNKTLSGIHDTTGCTASIEEVRISIFHGVVFNNLTIFDKNKDGAIVLHVPEAHALPLFLPFFKERKILIPSLSISEARFFLDRDSSGTLNIAPILHELKNKKNAPASPILLKKVTLKNTEIRWQDNALQNPFTAILSSESFEADLSALQIKIKASGNIKQDTLTSPFDTRMDYVFASGELSGRLLARNINSTVLTPYLSKISVFLKNFVIDELKTDFSFQDGLLSGNPAFKMRDIDFEKDGIKTIQASLVAKAQASYSFKDPQAWRAQGSGKLFSGEFLVEKDFKAKISPKDNLIRFSLSDKEIDLACSVKNIGVDAGNDAFNLKQADISADLSLKILSSAEDKPTVDFQGTAVINAAKLEGLPRVDSIENLSAAINFKNKNFSANEITGLVLGQPVSGQAALENNTLFIWAKGNFSLTALLALLPQTIVPKGWAVEALVSLSLKIEHPLDGKRKTRISGENNLADLSITLPDKTTPFTAPKGLVKFDTEDESLIWHFDEIVFKNDLYSLDGKSKGFSQALVTLFCVSDEIKIKTEFNYHNETLDFSSLSGSYKKIEYDLTGRFNTLTQETTAQGKVNLDLKDAVLVLRAGPEAQKAQPEGRCALNLRFSGALKDLLGWNLSIAGQSEKIKLWGLTFKNISLDYKQSAGQGFINDLTFRFYGGDNQVKGRVDFQKDGFSYSLRTAHAKINLGLLKNDFPSKETQLEGILDLKTSFQGTGFDPESIKGRATLNIRNGNIWEFKPLKGLGSFIFIPRLTSIVFDSAQGDLYAQNSKIATDNLELYSPELGLLIQGTMGFDGMLDFYISTQLSNAIPLPDKATDIFNRTGGLTVIKVTGSAKDPKYKLQTLGQNVVKKISDIFSGILP